MAAVGESVEVAPSPEPEAADGDAPAPEEEVTAQWESKYKDLKEVKVESGEEEDDILFKMRCKLFHFLKAEEKYGGAMEWKEKGVGELLLQPPPRPRAPPLAPPPAHPAHASRPRRELLSSLLSLVQGMSSC